MELVYLLVGIAGGAFLIFAFTLMRLLTRTARLLAISLLTLLAILLGSRLVFSGGQNTSNFFLPWDQPQQLTELARSGWVETPFIILEQILADTNNANRSTSPPPLPSPVLPSPAPLPADRAQISPSPALPSPTFSPAPQSPATQPPATQPPVTQPPVTQLPPSRTDPYPDQYPDQYPDNPYPSEPFSPGQPPTNEANPSQPPIPAWW